MWKNIQESILERGNRFIVAASGGIDSMFTIDFMHSLTKSKYGYGTNFIVATFDHDDHPDSAKFCEFVESFCNERGIDCVIGKGYTDKAAFMKQGGIEAMHRVQRYSFLKKVMEENSADCVITGHHLNDQIETILLRLFRGYPHRYLTMANSPDFYVFRPFLKVTREQIQKHAENRKIPYMDDPTNDSDAYERNWVRHTLLPQILEKRNVIKSMGKAIGKSGFSDEDVLQLIETGTMEE